MTLCPSTAVVILFWLASMAFCFYGKAYAEDKSEVRKGAKKADHDRSA
ncbi:MAG: hypothetical protein V1887_02805 [Candidatus Aenigmatarchaeota archaeon]